MDKAKTPHQLPFELPSSPAHAREDLIVTAANTEAVSFLDSWPDWPGPVTILAGPTGSGKTHLAHIWSIQANAQHIAASNLKDQDLSVQRSRVIEGVEAATFCQTALFHAINSALQNKTYLLITSRFWPADWDIDLADLQSRLKLAHILELNEPDDVLLSGVLMKLFADRQVMVDQSVVDYLVVRMERSLASAQTVVEKLDALSLSKQKRVTKHLAAEVLQQMDLLP